MRATLKAVLASAVLVAALSCRVESRGHQADIVYAMDQSGSMALRYVWISPDNADTVYLNASNGCGISYYTSADMTGFGQLTVPIDSGTLVVPRINPAKKPPVCYDMLSGDPFSQRAIAFRQAIDYQALRAPDSRAGYMGFTVGLTGATTPRPLDSQANVAALKGNINIFNGSGTNYLIALEQAKKWLADTILSTYPAKAVVFLSDGRPNYPDSAGYLEALSETYAAAPGVMPPIYGIFMGNPRPDTVRLHELTQLTGGRFFLVPPHRPDSLRTVMKRVVDLILDLEPSTVVRMPRNPRISNPAAANTVLYRASGGELLIDWSRRPAQKANLLGRFFAISPGSSSGSSRISPR